jgi:hypothetical protein
MRETAATRKKLELTFSVQSGAFFSMPMGTEEEPEQEPCQRSSQLRPVYLGYFEDEWGKGRAKIQRGEAIVNM